MSDILPRIRTGLFLVIFIIFSIFFSPYSFILLVLIINSIGVLEFYRLFALNSFEKASGILLSSFYFITTSLIISGIFEWKIILLNIPIVFITFVAELYLLAENPFKNLAFKFLALISITTPCIFLIGIAYHFPIKESYQPFYLMGLFLIIWAGDSGAYLIGKTFGKHSLFSRVSPNKTWEGTLGGAAFAILLALIVSAFFTELNIINWITIACITYIIGTFGDLIKSLMKRSLGVKDTGKILPGHGGIIDRFDSLLSSAPFVYSYLILTSK